MSILIKGLNMPATMAALIAIDNGEVVYKPLGNYGEKGEWRRSYKHAVELPPHGRLIDADELYGLLDGGYDIDLDELPETKRELLRMIVEAPTIIEAEDEE